MLFAIIVIPVGVAAWIAIWRFGFVTSLVAFMIAIGASLLYRYGAGGMSRWGAIIITVITLGTVALAIFGGLVSDAVVSVTDHSSLTPLEALTNPNFWRFFGALMGDSDYTSAVAPSVVFAVLFGLLGSARTLVTAFRQTARPAAAVGSFSTNTSLSANTPVASNLPAPAAPVTPGAEEEAVPWRELFTAQPKAGSPESTDAAEQPEQDRPSSDPNPPEQRAS